ncbi:ImmA/IrrE family metallo-endopeptidase [Rufibacter sp. XAAS-G3-1]|uniref:ImmA/IrrE family metallo-endopeptidase n=1 Tax=Rufibacter sp. XAAS-G3-1 TaxID=2729134 RepID=UPI0015E66824|nr:ImmA/IrrE family metallo-endopeptidase [Rufibacter sp. XAAS-G3-1]
MLGINPLKAANDVRQSLGCSDPGDISLEEMVFALGGILKESPMQGAEGCILMSGNNAVITVNSNIASPGKRNFVIAHEIGHFVLHNGLTPLYSDTDKTLAEWHRNGPQEQQANQFASELLMPSDLFKSKVAGKKLSLSLIEQTAAYFGVSLTAAFLKYKDLGSYPVMVIYIEGGVIQWKQASSDFPFQWLLLKEKVPVYTVAGDYFNDKGLEAKPEKVDAIEWFPSDFQLKYDPNCQLWEQCFPVSVDGLISCLWTL